MPSGFANAGEKAAGDPNIMKIKDVNKVRPLDNMVAAWRQHGIEHPDDGERFASVVCPGARSCPLCRKPVDAKGDQRFPVSRRFAFNVWDYDTNSVKVLVCGPQVFDPMKQAAAVGIEPASCDWTITKSGSRRNTAYEVIRHNTEPFTKPVTADMLHDVSKYEAPESTEKIFETLEKFGIDYDSLPIPQFTLDEALAYKMPYTKQFKGSTIDQMVSQDPGFAQWLHSQKLEQGQLGDPVFIALQTVLESRSLVPPLEDAIAALPAGMGTTPTSSPPAAPTGNGPGATPSLSAALDSTPAASTPRVAAESKEGLSASSANMHKLVNVETGDEVMVPNAAVSPMLASGKFREPEPESTEPKPLANIAVLIGGQQVELPADHAQALIASGTATPAQPEPAPEPEAPKLPEPDEVVQIDINGAEISMEFGEAIALVESGVAAWLDPQVAAAYSASLEPAGEPPASEPSSEASASVASPSEAAAPASSDDKPFKCDQCNWTGRTSGALTQHKNKAHGPGQEPAAPSAAAAPPVNSDDQATRLKAKVAASSFARDFTRMMAIFKEVTGKTNITEMSEQEMAALEARIDQESDS